MKATTTNGIEVTVSKSGSTKKYAKATTKEGVTMLIEWEYIEGGRPWK